LPLLTHHTVSLQGVLIALEQAQESLHFWTLALEGNMYQLIQARTRLLSLAFQADNTLQILGYCRENTNNWNLAEVDMEQP